MNVTRAHLGQSPEMCNGNNGDRLDPARLVMRRRALSQPSMVLAAVPISIWDNHVSQGAPFYREFYADQPSHQRCEGRQPKPIDPNQLLLAERKSHDARRRHPATVARLEDAGKLRAVRLSPKRELTRLLSARGGL